MFQQDLERFKEDFRVDLVRQGFDLEMLFKDPKKYHQLLKKYQIYFMLIKKMLL
jgi:hypothetical protein